MNTATEDFVDKCTARWLFEKTGVQLYDWAMEKCPEHLKGRLQEIRDQEKDHEETLEDVIRKYGADPHTLTPSAKLTEHESEGIVAIARDEEDFHAVMDALLSAEAIDNVDWEVLVELADELGDDEAREKFEDALEEENEHLDFIRNEIINEFVEEVRGSEEEGEGEEEDEEGAA